MSHMCRAICIVNGGSNVISTRSGIFDTVSTRLFEISVINGRFVSEIPTIISRSGCGGSRRSCFWFLVGFFGFGLGSLLFGRGRGSSLGGGRCCWCCWLLCRQNHVRLKGTGQLVHIEIFAGCHGLCFSFSRLRIQFLRPVG
jgi:hypothetical protein